jgi:hypothetical protein
MARGSCWNNRWIYPRRRITCLTKSKGVYSEYCRKHPTALPDMVITSQPKCSFQAQKSHQSLERRVSCSFLLTWTTSLFKQQNPKNWDQKRNFCDKEHFFLPVLGFKLRVLCLVGRCSSYWASSPRAYFLNVIADIIVNDEGHTASSLKWEVPHYSFLSLFWRSYPMQ